MKPRLGAYAIGWIGVPHLTEMGKARRGASLGCRKLRLLFGYVK